MKHSNKLTIFILAFFSAFAMGCSSGPEKAINAAAEAIKNKDPEAFEKAVDIKTYFEISQSEQMAAQKQAMSAILGSAFANKSMKYANSMLPPQTVDKAVKDFKEIISTGQITLMCQQSKKPDCPWLAESLEKAATQETGSNSAVASVDTPNGLRQWLAIRKYEDAWKIMGVTSTEERAKYLASDKRIADIQKAKEEAERKAKEEAARRERERERRQIAIYKNYEKQLEDYSVLKEKAEATRNKSNELASKIIFTDFKANATTKGNHGEGIVLEMRASIKNTNEKRASNYTIKFNVLDGDNSVHSFSYRHHRAELPPHQKLNKSWKFWIPEISSDKAQYINQGKYRIVPSVIYAIIGRGELKISDNDRDLLDWTTLSLLRNIPQKPKGYDEWKSQQ